MGQNLSKELNIHHQDLDEMHWLPGWKSQPKEVLGQMIQDEIISLPEWIVTGNYTTAGRDSIWKDAQTIIWLDYRLPMILKRYVQRTYRRIRDKEEVCNGNVETLRNAIFTEEILLRYILKSHFTRRPLYKDWMTGEMRDKQWIVLKNQTEAEELIISSRENLASSS